MKFFDRVSGASIRRAAGRALLASAALTLLSACGDDLDRGSAAELVASTAVPEDIHHDFGKDVFFCLREQQYLNANIMGASLTAEGQRFFRSMKFNSYGADSGFAFAQPMTFKDVEVTGITEMAGQGDDAPKRVEFKASYTFPGVPPESAAYQCLTKAPQPITGTVAVQKYDDGWRITAWDVPQFSSIAM